MGIEHAPQYHETCGGCSHTQQWHIGVTKGILNGHMVACRIHDCDCTTWQSTWR